MLAVDGLVLGLHQVVGLEDAHVLQGSRGQFVVLGSESKRMAIFQGIAPRSRKKRKQLLASTHHKGNEIGTATVVIVAGITWTIG